MEIRLDCLYLTMAIYYLIDYDEATSRDGHGKPMKRKNKTWTTQQEVDLMFFDVLTDTGEPNHFTRISSMWHKEYPDVNITDNALYMRLQRLRAESREEDEPVKLFKWNEELEQELWYVYRHTRPYKNKATMRFEEEWKRRHPDHQARETTLIHRVQKLLRESKFSGYGAQESPNTDFEWDKHYDADLFHAHNVALGDGKHHWRNIHQTWSELYPQYSHVTPEQLKERVEHLNENLPNMYFPWTKEQDQELLDIYERTMPDVENQGQRIYDIWSEIHPQYKFMTPYYLQVHASSLAHKRDIAAGKNIISKRTDEYQAELVDMYHRHRGRRRDFHEEWVRKYPRRAYMSAASLARSAGRYAVKIVGTQQKEMEEGSQAETPKIERRKYDKYTPEEKQEMFDLYDRTDPQSRGHSWRIEREMKEKQRDHNSITGCTVKQLVRLWRGEISRKKSSKAPMKDPSDEARPSSASRMSENSE